MPDISTLDFATPLYFLFGVSALAAVIVRVIYDVAMLKRDINEAQTK